MFKNLTRYGQQVIDGTVRVLRVVAPILPVLTIGDYLFNKWKVGGPILAWISARGREISLQLSSQPFLSVAIFVLSISLFFFWRRLQIVAGEFKDDFSKGLEKWEFGGEGWKTEKEDGVSLLSVSESQDGGISKKGFSWSDYEFSFETKIIKHNSGWIFRAESRSKYLMLQLHFENVDNPKLRLHLKIPSGLDYQWLVIQEDSLRLSKKISPLEWIKVKIIVFGSNVDVYLNNEHAGHYFIADPLRIPSKETVSIVDVDQNGKKIERNVSIVRPFISMDYSIGRVGFRCAPPYEHAHFRKVSVKPLLG